MTVRNDTKSVAFELARVQARAAAEAGFWRAVYSLMLPEQSWPTNGRAVNLVFDSAKVSIMTQDLSGLADLNSASPELLEALISHALQEPKRAIQIAARIADWRDRDNRTRPAGAENEDYMASGLDYTVKNAPFNAREELELVLGVSLADYDAIAPFVTVHSQKTSIDLAVAPRYITNALFKADRTATLKTNTSNHALEQNTILYSHRNRRVANFEIRVQANVNNVISRLSASIEIDPSRRSGQWIAILAWRETWPYQLPKIYSNENTSTG
tara:strand:- start:3242 stop:4054 length:813 start_codon:yes stop_codon:yes gene_type:complete